MDQSKIKTIIEEIFTRTGCAISECTFSEENGMTWCMISTPDSRFIIGREGETLRSLNHIVRKILEKEAEEAETLNLWIDVNGYQKKRFDNLKNIAHMMAERAKYFKSNIEIDPMPASDRRIVHMFLEKTPNIKTESEGYGENRRVVIKYID
jgi:spoIIIJ-associated protein